MLQIQDKMFDIILEEVREGRSDRLRLDGDTFDRIDERMKLACTIQGLKTIVLEDTDISDVGVQVIASIPQLTTLKLLGARVTDDGLKFLNGKSSLKHLTLRGIYVTSKGLSVLQTLPNLESLCIDREVAAPITMTFEKEVIAVLKDLRLEELEVGGNWISNDGVGELRKAMPRTKVRRLLNGQR